MFLNWKNKLKQFKIEYLEILRIKKVHEEEGENFCTSVRVCNFCSKSYIEYESIDDRNKAVSVEEYYNKTKPFKRLI